MPKISGQHRLETSKSMTTSTSTPITQTAALAVAAAAVRASGRPKEKVRTKAMKTQGAEIAWMKEWLKK
jgi:hypothetical protein